MSRFKNWGIATLLVFAASITGVTAAESYNDPNLPVEKRVANLLAQMTLEEKCEQLRQMDVARLQVFDGAVSAESLERVFKGKTPGVVLLDQRGGITSNTIKARDLQNYLRKNSRLKIPALFVTGGTQGVLAKGATIFPSPIALGATWNPPLVRAMSAKIADEASAMGAAQLLGPSFALGRDPRFGGIENCFSECPTLVTEMGLAYLEGLQGKGVTGGLAPNKVFGTALHFTGWGVPSGGLFGAEVSLSSRSLRALHLLPFEKAVTDGEVQSVMPVENALNGVPGHTNPWLLDNVLRTEWQFPGYVYSAPSGIEMSAAEHRVATDLKNVAHLAVTAGVDVETDGKAYFELENLVKSGALSEAEIDKAAGRILRLKFLAGLFEERRSPDPSILDLRVRSKETRALGRQLAGESIVLLKNTDNFLPLDTNRIKTLAVIGPNATRVQMGDGAWSNDEAVGTSVVRGLRNLLGNRIRINQAQGCEIHGTAKSGIAEAVSIAKGSDAVLLVLGDESASPQTAVTEDAVVQRHPTSGTGYDVANPVPPGMQEELVRAIVATGRPTIVLFVHGRPYSTPWIKDNVTAILSSFYSGEAQGTAIADVLFGNIDPGGRLPVSIAHGAGHLPVTYDYTPGARGLFGAPGSPDKPGRDYVFSPAGPLWPFGYGLSYTQYEYSDLVMETSTVPADGVVRVHFTLKNTGARDGFEVVQVYYHDNASNVSSVSKRLVRFEKIFLKSGQSVSVLLAFEANMFAQWDRLMRKRTVVPGDFDILVGSSSEDIKLRGKIWVR